MDGVTKLTRIELQSDASRQAENFRKLVLAMSEDIRVLLVKLADRLHNMRTIDHLKPEKRRRIAIETMEIYAPLAERIGMQEIKSELEDRSFSVLNPEAVLDHGEARVPARGGKQPYRHDPGRNNRSYEGSRDFSDHHGAGKISLFRLAEDAASGCRLRATFRYHGFPRDR